MTERVITKKELMSVFVRQFFLQSSWNFERMQAAGYMTTLLPALRKLYKDDEEGLRKAATRNLEFFNTQPYLAAPIFGVALAMEERMATHGDVDGAAITAVKVGTMGPFAGVGDSLFWFTIRPICLGIGISLAEGGNILGPIVFLLIFNVFHLATRWYGVMEGYKLGVSFMSRLAEEGIVQRVTETASVLGLMVLGVMIASMVNVPFIFSIGTGDAARTFMSIADSIVPKILSLGLTFLLSFFLRKGVTPIRILYVILAVSVLGAYFKILG